MKKIYTFIGIIIGASLTVGSLAYAISASPTNYGGSGTTTPSGILYGDNGLTSHLNTVSIGSGLSFSAGTLSSLTASTFGTTSISALYPLNWNTSNAQLSTVATSSLGLTVSSFASPNISQWTNNSGYLTTSTANPLYLNVGTTSVDSITTLSNLSLPFSQISGTVTAASSTLLADTNTWSGSNIFTNPLIVNGTGATSTFAGDIKVRSLQLNAYHPYAQVYGLDSDTGLGFDGPDILSLHTGGTNRLYINAIGEVSIATTSTNDVLAIQGLGSSNIIEAYDSTGSSKLIVKSTGNVGIGTTSPSSNLHVSAGASGVLPLAGTTLTLESSSGNYLSILTPSNISSGILFGTPTSNLDASIMYNSGGSARDLQFRNGGNLTRLLINSSGNVGIGTSTPSSKLSVQGNSIISGDLSVADLTATGTVALTDGATGYTGIQTPLRFLTLTSGTTTTWTASTSGAYIPKAVAPFAGTIRYGQCATDAGFLNVDIYHTSTHLPLLIGASSTPGLWSFTSNNTFTAGEVIYGSMGTTTTSVATSISCTLGITQTN